MATGKPAPLRSRLFESIVAALCLLLPGCADKTSEKPAGYDRSENALHDPMNYSPGFDKPGKGKDAPPAKEPDGLKKDLDTVFNP